MTYLTRWEKAWIEEGHKSLVDGSIQLHQALDESRSPNCHEYRKDVFPNLASWMQHIKDKNLGRAKEMAIFGPVKEHAIDIILRVRKDQPIVTAISMSNPKPVLKVKKAKKVETEGKLYSQEEYDKGIEKAVAIANSKKDNEFKKERFQYKQIIDCKDKELETKDVVINQLIANNIKVVQAFGVKITAESVGL